MLGYRKTNTLCKMTYNSPTKLQQQYELLPKLQICILSIHKINHLLNIIRNYNNLSGKRVVAVL